ncbi:hypothetical protein EYC08_21170 [Tabrizicola sp. WMC-M-20]|nr:hypothetical protein EYC08_21170 [Tabrizicola sp. WMC-M-20]
MTSSPDTPETPTSSMQISEELIIELIDLLKSMIENSGTGRTAEQMKQLIVELSIVGRSADKLSKALIEANRQELELRVLSSKIDAQSRLIAQIGKKVSQMYPVLFEPATQDV